MLPVYEGCFNSGSWGNCADIKLSNLSLNLDEEGTQE